MTGRVAAPRARGVAQCPGRLIFSLSVFVGARRFFM